MIPFFLKRTSAVALSAALVLSSLLNVGLSVWAQDSPDAQKIFLILAEGNRPEISDPQYLEEKKALYDDLVVFSRKWKDSLSSNSVRCQRFSAAVETLNKDLLQNLEVLPGPTQIRAGLDQEQVIAKARFHLLVPTFFSLHNLFSAGGDGGYSLLDSEARVKCFYNNRDELALSFDVLVKDLSRFHLNAVGNPGILGIDRMIESLLSSAQDREKTRNRVSLAFLGAGAIASIFLWELAPPIVMKITGTSMAMGPLMAFGVRSVAIAAESATYQFAEHKFNPEPPVKPVNKTRSWEEQMRDVELIIADSETPEVQISFLIQVQAQMAQMFGPWLKRNGVFANTPERKSVLAQANEAVELVNTPFPLMSEKLSEIIKSNYGYKLRCSSSWSQAASEIQCLRGIRTFARVLYTDRIPRLSTSESEVLDIEVTGGQKPQVEFQESMVHLYVPFAHNPAKISSLIVSTVTAPLFNQAVVALQRFEAYKENVSVNIGIPIEFADYLNLAQKWHSLIQLEILARNDPEIFDRATEVFNIGSSFRNTYELSMKLTEDIDARADWRQISDFLKGSQSPENRSFTRIESNREKVETEKEILAKELGVPIECSPMGGLNSERCLEGLNRLSNHLKWHAGLRPKVRGILITSASEIPLSAQELQADRRYLALRYDFDFMSLEDIGLQKGWYK